MIVSLVGLMGTGKSTVARALAERLGWVARDLDQLIEVDTGQTIGAVFQVYGEAGFRVIEARVLDAVLAHGMTIVLATGGGASCQPGAMTKLKAAGPVIWLHAPPELLVARALTDDRPLLASRTPAEAEAFLRTQLEARRPRYSEADHHVDASRPLAEVVDEVAGLLGYLLPTSS